MVLDPRRALSSGLPPWRVFSLGTDLKILQRQRTSEGAVRSGRSWVRRSSDMKSEMKIEVLLAAILVAATLVSVNALVSAVQKGERGAVDPVAIDSTSNRN